MSRCMNLNFEMESCKNGGGLKGDMGSFYLLLELAELIVLLLSVLVDFFLSFGAGVFDALGSVYGISPWVSIGNWFWLKELRKGPGAKGVRS